MTAPLTTWAVTKMNHPGTIGISDDCADCLAITDTAIDHARVTASVGCTYGDGRGHEVTVARVHAVHTRGGDPLVSADAPITTEMLRADWDDDSRLSAGTVGRLEELPDRLVQDAINEAFRPFRRDWHTVLDSTREVATGMLLDQLRLEDDGGSV